MHKVTGLVVSHEDMKQACRQCPEGKCASGESRSVVAGRCTKQFVQAFLQPVLAEMSECLYPAAGDRICEP